MCALPRLTAAISNPGSAAGANRTGSPSRSANTRCSGRGSETRMLTWSTRRATGPVAAIGGEYLTGAGRNGENPGMRVERSRDNVFTVTATSQELSALVAAARMALNALRSAPEPPPADALATLERVLGDYDRALERLGTRPPAGG